MFRLYDYLYYKILRCIELLDDEIPSFVALCVLSILNAFQLVIAWSVLLYFFPEMDAYRTKFMALIIAFVIFGSNWFLFQYKTRWREVYNRFEKESMRSNIIGTTLVLIYIFLSIWICFKVSGPWIIENF